MPGAGAGLKPDPAPQPQKIDRLRNTEREEELPVPKFIYSDEDLHMSDEKLNNTNHSVCRTPVIQWKRSQVTAAPSIQDKIRSAI
jgi:hypothetical protein